MIKISTPCFARMLEKELYNVACLKVREKIQLIMNKQLLSYSCDEKECRVAVIRLYVYVVLRLADVFLSMHKKSH